MLRGALSFVLSLCIQRKNNKIKRDCYILPILKIEKGAELGNEACITNLEFIGNKK